MTQSTTYREASRLALPFVTPDSYFTAEPKDRESACSEGRLFAAHLTQYIVDNPIVSSGIICRIITDMQHRPDLDGQIVGFCGLLEEIIFQCVQPAQPFCIYRGTERRYQVLLASRRVSATEDWSIEADAEFDWAGPYAPGELDGEDAS